MATKIWKTEEYANAEKQTIQYEAILLLRCVFVCVYMHGWFLRFATKMCKVTSFAFIRSPNVKAKPLEQLLAASTNARRCVAFVWKSNLKCTWRMSNIICHAMFAFVWRRHCHWRMFVWESCCAICILAWVIRVLRFAATFCLNSRREKKIPHL